MPRFGTKSLLFCTAIVAIWISTIPRVYEGSEDVRASLKMLVIVAAALAAYCLTGRQRVFWMGFAATWLLSILVNSNFAPQFIWATRLLEGRIPRAYNSAIFDTISPVHLLIVSVIAILLLRRRLPQHPPVWAWLTEHWRFSTRDLLIATTLIAVALALAVWALTK